MAADPDSPERREAEEHLRRPAAPERGRALGHPEHGAPQHPAERLAASVGNRNFNAFLARMPEGSGILGDGTVHPDVQAAIAATSGRGSRLDRRLLSTFSGSHGDLSDARVHTGPEADTLARSVNAVAFTVGSDVFFRHGAYDPHSRHGQELLAHELAHVVQQRGAPASGPLQVTDPGDAMEREADAVARGAQL
jgi:hypothetical protein